MGMTREKQMRKKELFKKLFMAHTHEPGESKRQVESSEVMEFLGLAARSHKAFYHFSERNPKGLGSVSWNGEIANETRCKEGWFRDAAKAFPGFVKDGGWDYEGETRISIELPEDAGKYIFIPFGGALKTVKVLAGPGQAAPEYLRMAKERLAKWKIGVEASVCKVQFPEWEKKGKGKG